MLGIERWEALVFSLSTWIDFYTMRYGMAVLPDPTSSPALKEHLLHFYESDVSLLDAMSAFIGAGLRASETCFLFATQAHHESLQERLKENGIDVLAAQERGEYRWFDAAEMLSKLMLDDMPESERFAREVGDLIAQATSGQRHVRIFGEMVALLWEQGNFNAVTRLEELWNDLYQRLNAFSLFCAYPMHSFSGQAHAAQFLEIIRLHSHLIPAGVSSLLIDPDEQLQAIALLQRKTYSLETEIEQREEVEQRLRVSEEALYRLAAIVESSDDAIVSKTLDGIITSWNASAERLFGYSAEEAVGRHITLIIPPELYPEEDEILRKLRQGERIKHYETVRVRKDGRRVDVSLSISPVKDRNGKIIGGSKIARDIGERRELERRKDEFIAMASHELKTPVTSLKGFTQLLQRRLRNSGNEEDLRFLTRMDTQVNRLTHLVDDLLNLTKMQTGKLEYRMEAFDLAELVQEIVENVQEATQTHRLLLEKTVVASVYGDRDRIGQVLTNLLTNAIKYSKDADRVIIRMEVSEGNVIVSVQDFGIGIPQEYQQRIFERFFRVSETGGTTYSGLGIGLYISRNIIKRHQGKLGVQSRKGEGSTFFFQLPLAQTANVRVEEGD
jgi:PAS domain S-box-containing protein